MSELGLVYLIRARNGPQPVRDFLDAYARNRGGVDHDLLVVYKGFARPAGRAPYESMLAPFAHRSLRVPDRGFDLRAYFAAARHFDYPVMGFLNSFSIPLDENWLVKLHRHLRTEGVGLVGATGSWESLYSNIVQETETGLPRAWWQRALRGVRWRWAQARFRPFPNPNVRTNAFLIAREVMLKVREPRLWFKIEALQFESGIDSLTQQVQRMQRKALLVGRDGRAYEPEDWPASNTYRHEDQANLLVADNRTRQFAQADAAQRRLLSRLAWGDQGKV